MTSKHWLPRETERDFKLPHILSISLVLRMDRMKDGNLLLNLWIGRDTHPPGILIKGYNQVLLTGRMSVEMVANVTHSCEALYPIQHQGKDVAGRSSAFECNGERKTDTAMLFYILYLTRFAL